MQTRLSPMSRTLGLVLEIIPKTCLVWTKDTTKPTSERCKDIFKAYDDVKYLFGSYLSCAKKPKRERKFKFVHFPFGINVSSLISNPKSCISFHLQWWSCIFVPLSLRCSRKRKLWWWRRLQWSPSKLRMSSIRCRPKLTCNFFLSGSIFRGLPLHSQLPAARNRNRVASTEHVPLSNRKVLEQWFTSTRQLINTGLIPMSPFQLCQWIGFGIVPG